MRQASRTLCRSTVAGSRYRLRIRHCRTVDGMCLPFVDDHKILSQNWGRARDLRVKRPLATIRMLEAASDPYGRQTIEPVAPTSVQAEKNDCRSQYS